MLALHLEDLGCATVMPLRISYWFRTRFNNLTNIQIIIENANVPVIVDAGIGTPSEATQAMEIGADGVLLNTAVAQSKNPAQMAYAMKLGVQAGRLGLFSWSNGKKYYASASSPLDQISKLLKKFSISQFFKLNSIFIFK
jgi:thiazole synthase